MYLKVDKKLKEICSEILKQNKTLEEWRDIESSDMFQNETYNGGFDAIEDEFCFSVYIKEKEYWFQISLSDVDEIMYGKIKIIEISEADL